MNSKRYFLSILLLLMVSISTYGQSTIKGKVTDADDGSGIPGVSILEKGTGNGTITDIEGNYTLTLPSTDVVVQYSYIGYKPQEVLIGARSVIDIALEVDVEVLGEVVVIGYGSVEKKDVTGVISTVKADQFNKGIIGSPDKLLSGKVAGLQIATSNGEPGSSTNIRLRGRSINGETPLFVIDGVPLDDGGGGVAGGRNPLNFMNPNDVESVTVLKDASAAAIYGSRGANGVIIITTKSGQAGKMKISYSGFYSISKFTRQIDMLTPNEFRQAIFDKAPGEIADLGDVNTVWMDQVTQVASGMQHNVAISGGKNSTTYYVSLNYLNDKGILRNTSNQNTTLSLKLSQKLFNDNLSIKLTSKNGLTKDEFSPNVIGSALKFDPTRSVLDSDPNNMFGGYFQWNNVQTATNPVSEQDLNNQNGENKRSISNLELQYKLPFIPGLALNVNLGYDVNDGKYSSISSAFNRNARINEFGINTRFEDAKKTVKLYEVYGNYKKDIGLLEGTIDLTIGHSYQNFRSDFKPLAGDSSTLNDNGVWVPKLNVENQPSPLENRLISYYARAILSIKDRYVITASLRQDGSTKFGESNKWGLFPAAALAWRVLEEDFASSLRGTFSDLKFRLGYGVTGNQAIESYRYNTFYKTGTDVVSYQFGDEFVNTLRPRGVDPNIKWEENVTTNIGLDAGLFEGRLNVSLEYYVKDVNDLLLEINLPAGTNLSDVVYTNVGKVRNQGFELNMDAVVIDKSDMQWDVNFNISTNKNEVLKINNNTDPDFRGFERGSISGNVGERIQILKVGEEIEAFSTYVHKRNADGTLVIDPNGDGFQDKIEMYVDQLTEDTNGDGIADAGDGIINEKDKVITGSPNPNVLMGITSNLAYKNFDLSISIRGNFGQQVYNNVASANGFYDQLTDRVTNNIHASTLTTGFKKQQLFSDYYVEDASFVKLDNITLGYKFLVGNSINGKAYVTAQNIFTISGYSGIDPEIFNGIDNNIYPRSTSFIFGVSANF